MDQLSQTRLAEITAKSPADLTEADAAFLRARRSYLTEEQCVVFADVLDDGQNVSNEKPLSRMNLDELKAKAVDMQIEVADTDKKADVLAKIEAAQSPSGQPQ